MTVAPRTLRGPLQALDPVVLRGRASEAAPLLLGALLVRERDGEQIIARVVEVEAYEEDDPASHSTSGRSERNAAMFAEAGTAYVYRSYGVHWCLNVSVGPRGRGAAVLLRAAVVVTGLAGVQRRRPGVASQDALLRGPGCLTAGLDIDRPRHDGIALLTTAGPLWIAGDGWHPVRRDLATGPRVGVTRASEVPWRWYLRGEPGVSRYRRSARAGRASSASRG
ncbi:MAG: DNA-3-methyladenine glycosylase [Nitriliruptoraceae bacterium]